LDYIDSNDPKSNENVNEKKKKSFVEFQFIFKSCVEIWLELRKEMNFSFEKNKNDDNIDETISDKFQENDVYQNFEANFRGKYSLGFKIGIS
jgi:hypothetical protein